MTGVFVDSRKRGQYNIRKIILYMEGGVNMDNKRKKKLIIVCIAVLCILVLAGVAFVLLNRAAQVPMLIDQELG